MGNGVPWDYVMAAAMTTWGATVILGWFWRVFKRWAKGVIAEVEQEKRTIDTCPDCKGFLSRGATSCRRCGWEAAQEEEEE